MTSNIIQKLALAATSTFPIAATIATATVLSLSNPSEAASFYNFSFAGNDEYTILGSFSYDDTLYSGTIGKNQLNSFKILFLKQGKVEQQYSTLSSLFQFEFDTVSKSVKNMHAGAFYLYDMPPTLPNGSLTFETYKDNETGCDALVWEKTTDTQSQAVGKCDSDSEVVVTPPDPDTQTVPEPASTMSLIVVGAFGTVFQLKRTKKVA